MTFQSDPAKILIFSGVRGDTRRYRTLHLYEQLKLYNQRSVGGIDCALSHLTDPRLPEIAESASVVILHRVAYDRHVEKLFAAFRRRNALVILDADDFLYDPAIMSWIDSPDFKDPIRAALYRRELMRHRVTLDHCDAVTVSTQHLADLIEPFGKPVCVHRNAFSLEMLALSEKAFCERPRHPERVVIGYASGTRTHDKDLAMIQPCLRSVLDRFPQVELWLMGAVDPDLNWGAARDRVHLLPWVPWRDLPARLAEVDINLAPLVPDNPFNQAKSEIKFMESALVRVPTVASKTDAFCYAIQHGQNGFLAEDPESWQGLIENLIRNPELRRAVGEAAYQDVMARYHPLLRGQSIAACLVDLSKQTEREALALPYVKLPDLHNETAATGFQFGPEDEAHPTMPELALYSLKNRGIGTLLGQIWVFFRRLVSPIFPFRET